MLHKKILAFSLGTLLAGSTLISAAGAGWIEQIQVRNGIRLNLNGEEVIPVDASGKQMPVFLYQNTTYVPVRFLSEKFGKEVEWDGTNATVHIKDKEEQTAPDPDQLLAGEQVNLIDLINTEACLETNGVWRSRDHLEFHGKEASITFRLNKAFSQIQYQADTYFASSASLSIYAANGESGYLAGYHAINPLRSRISQSLSLAGADIVTLTFTSNSDGAECTFNAALIAA